MADVGVVLQRMLDPRWETVVGTLREWTDLEYMRGPMPGGGPGLMAGPPGRTMGPGAGVSFTIMAVGPPGAPSDPSHPPTESEGWRRMWVRRDGRYRVEHRTPGVAEPWLTEIVGPEATHVIRGDGSVLRSDPPLLQAFPTWMVDPGSLLGLIRLAFGAEDTFAGRPVVHAAATMRLELPPMAMSAGPVMYGMPIGGRSELTIDIETGIVVRFASFEGDRLVSLRQFVELAVDEDIDDEMVTFRLAPGQRLRGPHEDMLDLLRSQGEDVSDIDPDDAEAVQAAMQRFHERRREEHGSFVGPPPARPLTELVVSLGPAPDDPAAARTSIQEALDSLADDDRPRADGVERGEVLDRYAAAGNAPPRHPMLGDQTVTFVLGDVAFVRADEAMVEFQIHLSGGGAFPVKGRAVLTVDGWRLSYETWAGLQQMGGYRVPAVNDPDDPDEGPLT